MFSKDLFSAAERVPTRALRKPQAAEEKGQAEGLSQLPDTHAEFAAQVADLDRPQLAVALEKLRRAHCAQLAANGRHKLQVQ